MLLSAPFYRLFTPGADRPARPSKRTLPAPAAVPAAPRGLPPLTWAARRLFLGLALLFLAAVACNLNGSSTTYWHSAALGDVRVRDARVGLLFGLPKHIRGDEWFVWTPAFLSQARQPQPFPVSNPSLGPGVTPLLMSLPARHYTMLFRPQLWGFFVAPFDYAFSWYWNAKTYGLFAAMFALFWTLTGGRFGLAVFGAIAVQYSGFIQWWFSTPAMLPEMMACWAVGILATLTFFTAGSWRRHALAAAVFVVSLANFFLCCYPAFMIALLHLGVVIVLGYLWQQRSFSWRGTWWLVGALAVTALVLLPWVLDCLPTLRIESQTVYPGQRHIYGGNLPLYQYLDGLFALDLTEKTRTPGLRNICEAANFYPLWIVPLATGLGFFAGRVFRRDGKLGPRLADRGLQVALAGYAVLMTLYALVGLPPWFCDLTLMSREVECRSTLGLGTAGMMLLVLSLGSRPAGAVRPTRTALLFALAWCAGVAAFLCWYQALFAPFLTPWRVATLLLTAATAVTAYLWGPRWLLPVMWSVAFVTKLALVNPVCNGLPELLESPTMNRLAALVKADPSAQWAVYDSVPGVELIKTTGAHVVNGARIIPDFDVIDRLDPEHRHLAMYNQYSHLDFTDAPYAKDVTVSLFSVVYCKVGLHPRRLRELFPEVKYVVATHPIQSFAEAGFGLVGSVPQNNLWLYRLGSH